LLKLAMLSLQGNQARVRLFSPEKWNQVSRFICFYQATFKGFGEQTRGSLYGINGHYKRARLFFRLVPLTLPAIKADADELRIKGFSINEGAESLAAIFESIFCELHSSVDCICDVVAKIYEGRPGIVAWPSSSLIKNAEDQKIDVVVPNQIREALAKAEWFEELQILRNTIQHSNVGICELNKQTGIVSYRSRGQSKSGKPDTIQDVCSKTEYFFEVVNQFAEKIFGALNENLQNDEVLVLCGFFPRAYQRYVRCKEATDLHSGRCDSYKWFEQPENPRCPFADDCGAYKRAKEFHTA
jgi:hypothetical protein